MGKQNTKTGVRAVDQVQSNKILEETVKKEMSHFQPSSNFQTRAASLRLVTAKPNKAEVFRDADSENIRAVRDEIHRSTVAVPPDKFPFPVTSSHELGWLVHTANQQNILFEQGCVKYPNEERVELSEWNHPRTSCDLVKYAEAYVIACQKGPFERPSKPGPSNSY